MLLGLEEASDEEMQRWSQALIDGAGNFGWRDEPFAVSDKANAEMNALMDSLQDRHRAAGDARATALLFPLIVIKPIDNPQLPARDHYDFIMFVSNNDRC